MIGTTSQKACIDVNYDYVHYKPNTTKSLITAAGGSEGSFRGEPNPRETMKSCGEVLSLRLSKVTSMSCIKVTNFDRLGGCDREAGIYNYTDENASGLEESQHTCEKAIKSSKPL